MNASHAYFDAILRALSIIGPRATNQIADFCNLPHPLVYRELTAMRDKGLVYREAVGKRWRINTRTAGK